MTAPDNIIPGNAGGSIHPESAYMRFQAVSCSLIPETLSSGPLFIDLRFQPDVDTTE